MAAAGVAVAEVVIQPRPLDRRPGHDGSTKSHSASVSSWRRIWVLELAIIYRGMDALRRFENWAAPFVIVGAVVLLIWVAVKAGGFGPLLDQPSKLGWGKEFWPVFFPSLMGMIAFWATLSLNIPDFTRFGAGQRAQIRGQSLGLPTTMTLFALLSVLVTSGSQAVYGEAIWDPVQLVARTDNVFGLLYALVTVLVATVSVNIAANVVSPAYDLANLVTGVVRGAERAFRLRRHSGAVRRVSSALMSYV